MAERFEIVLKDGREAKCWQATSQPYKDCVFSAGLTEDIEPDKFYLCLERDDEVPLYIFMRPDEMLAILYVCLGALWSLSMIERNPDVQETET